MGKPKYSTGIKVVYQTILDPTSQTSMAEARRKSASLNAVGAGDSLSCVLDDR